MRLSACSLALAGLAVIAAPAAAAPKAAPKSKSPMEAMKPPNLDAMMGVFDKLFPPQPEPDPARLALARTSAATMWPEGAYRDLMVNFAGGMVDNVMRLKKSDFPTGDAKKAKADATADLSLHDAAAAKDPYFDQRVAAIRAAVTEEIGKVSAVIDPRMRDGMARAMARRFDARQLADINGFLATPSGRAFAGQYMQLWLDPDMLRGMMGTMPEMIKLMPDVMKKVKEANDKFPAPPSSQKRKPAKS
jgi:hypothetical protein